MNSNLVETANLFRSLHDATRPLALSNAWDVASALVTQAAGASAIATTSAGVAWALGLPDGNRLSRVSAVESIARIVAAVTVPVTADLEDGYADSPEELIVTVESVLEAGAVGINIEDGSRTPQDFAARIAASRRTADLAGIPLFVNARTDVFLGGIGDPANRLAETLARASRYIDAGADGVFIPGIVDIETIAALTSGVDAPVNVMAGPGAPNVRDLGRLGVSRVSLGSSVAQAAYAVAAQAAANLLSTGDYAALLGGMDYGKLNSLMARSHA
ncbi:isocitrate lyase/phosphoenolpyruvate mutase family protein [Arthrobacter sp. UYCu712]|uniref:isocitrate lyase/PEP mutase family protein n=1 Tax=Arthrobacter sp. UYCu712 TaxID=3156340 RepID=UPI00339722CF